MRTFPEASTPKVSSDPWRLTVTWQSRDVGAPCVLPRGEAQTAGSIAEHTPVSPATVTRLTARLLKQGLFSRAEDEGDRRLKRFWLTPAGERLLGQMSVAANAYMDAVCDRLSAEATDDLTVDLFEFNVAAERVQSEVESGI